MHTTINLSLHEVTITSLLLLKYRYTALSPPANSSCHDELASRMLARMKPRSNLNPMLNEIRPCYLLKILVTSV